MGEEEKMTMPIRTDCAAPGRTSMMDQAVNTRDDDDTDVARSYRRWEAAVARSKFFRERLRLADDEIVTLAGQVPPDLLRKASAELADAVERKTMIQQEIDGSAIDESTAFRLFEEERNRG